MRRRVYNLELPSGCHEMTIYEYRFSRVEDYVQKINRLQQPVNISSEFRIKANTGRHTVTAYVDLPDVEREAVFEWYGNKATALDDILLLLSVFRSRDVFLGSEEATDDNELIIRQDPRVYLYGGSLSCSVLYKRGEKGSEQNYPCNVGFQEAMNKIYSLIRTEKWLKKYRNGYFIILARNAFRQQSLESSFIQAWTIWEHLFAVLNGHWLSKERLRQVSSVEKVSFLLVQYALKDEIDNASRKRIEVLAEIRNRLIHFGRFPARDKVSQDAHLFILLTEFIIAKILELEPSNVFNTVEKLEDFLKNSEAAAKKASSTKA